MHIYIYIYRDEHPCKQNGAIEDKETAKYSYIAIAV